MAHNPYAFPREIDPENGNHVWRADVRESPPVELGLLAGDCIHNLRASLDNLAWGLGRAFKDPPPDRLSFPICWESKADTWKFKAFEPAVRKAIRDVQPYHRPKTERARDPLYVLDKLWNGDKHRVSPIVGGVAIGSRLHIIEVSGTGSFSDHVETGPFHHGKEVARCVVPTGPNAKANIEAEFAVSVAFAEGSPSIGLPLLETLTYLHDYIRDQVFARIEGAL